MIFIKGVSRDLPPRLFDNRVVQQQKDNGAGFNLEGMEELMESRKQNFIIILGILSEGPGEIAEGSGKKRSRQGLDHGGGLIIFSQLDKANDEGRKEFERRG